MTSHAFFTFVMGQATPYGKRPDGAALLIGPDPLTLIVSLSEPSAAEIAEIRRGRLRVGLAAPVKPGGAALLVWRFEPLTSGSPGLWFDTPFHIGLNAPADRCLPLRRPDQYRTVIILVQDEAGRFRGGRMVTLSPAFCDRLDPLVQDQALAAADPGWTYDHEIAQALDRWPTPRTAMGNATVSEIAGLALEQSRGSSRVPSTPAVQ